MVITFPHMGNIFVLMKTLFDEMNIEYIIPPKCSKRTLELGTKFAPEMACLPLKINIGNFIESIELGADIVIITGACGPCRFGYYSEMHREILHDLGYDVEVIALEYNEKGLRDLLSKLKRMIGNKNLSSMVVPLYKALKALRTIDKLEEFSFKIRPREIEKGATDNIFHNMYDKLPSAKGYKQIMELFANTKKQLENLPIDKDKDIIKIGIVGEIYTLIEPFTNLNMESVLGNMGIEVNRSLYISQWIIDHIIKEPLHLTGVKDYILAATPYLKTKIGGHAIETIGNSVLYAKDGYDGVIQIYPLTCMPEIVADSIMPSVSQDYQLPTLTLIMDEITGEAGYMTRIDAFADMLKIRKELKEVANEAMLSGC